MQKKIKLRSAGIATNPLKPQTRIIKLEMTEFLREIGVKVLPPHRSQILITLGGDGTILYNKNRYRKPIWAVGSKTSFITQSRKDCWKSDLGRLIERGFRVEKRGMLSSKLDGRKLPDALNEVVVRSGLHRVIEIDMRLGKKRYHFLADGLIISTATGSSAYAYSAGGKQMRPDEKSYQIVPIAPYRRLFKPMVVSPNTVCIVRVSRNCRADAVVDGQNRKRMKDGDTLRVRMAKRCVEFVRTVGKKRGDIEK